VNGRRELKGSVRSSAESVSVSVRSLNVRVPPDDVVLNWSCSPGGAVYVVNRVSGSFCSVREYAVRQSSQRCDQRCSPPSCPKSSSSSV